MKKRLLVILVAILVVVSVVGVTAIVSNRTTPPKAVLRDTNEKATSSELYEVVEFIPPNKTVYQLSEVYSIDISANEEKRFVQHIDFDGTGMSMTVKHKETGEITKYDYTCKYFDLEGEPIKCEEALSFYFNPGVNVVLTEGTHTTEIMLCTDGGECVLHEMEFTLVNDTKPEATQAPTKPKNETQSQQKPQTQEADNINNENNTNQVETSIELVIPQLRSLWYHANNPNGCTIEATNQNGNTLELTICSSNENATKIATATVNVTLNDVYEDGTLIRGNGSFEYVDSFENTGTGTISISENVILLVINEEYNSGKGFGISNTSGKYL